MHRPRTRPRPSRPLPPRSLPAPPQRRRPQALPTQVRSRPRSHRPPPRRRPPRRLRAHFPGLQLLRRLLRPQRPRPRRARRPGHLRPLQLLRRLLRRLLRPRAPPAAAPGGSEHTFQRSSCSAGCSARSAPGRGKPGAQDTFGRSSCSAGCSARSAPGRAARGSRGGSAGAFAGRSPGWRSECDAGLPRQRFRSGGRRCRARDRLLVSLEAGPEGQCRSRQRGETQRLDHRPVAREPLHRHEAGWTDPVPERAAAEPRSPEACPHGCGCLGRRPHLRRRCAVAVRLGQSSQLFLVVRRGELDPLRHRRTRRSPCASVDAGARAPRSTGGSGPTIGHPRLPDRAARASLRENRTRAPAPQSKACPRAAENPIALRGAYVGRAGATCGAVDSRP